MCKIECGLGHATASLGTHSTYRANRSVDSADSAAYCDRDCHRRNDIVVQGHFKKHHDPERFWAHVRLTRCSIAHSCPFAAPSCPPLWRVTQIRPPGSRTATAAVAIQSRGKRYAVFPH